VFQNLSRGIEELLAKDARYRDLKVVVFHGPTGVPYRSQRFEYVQTPSALGRFTAESRLGAFWTKHFDATLFPNYFTPLVVRSQRVVTIIHDLLYLHLPDTVSRQKKVWLKWCHQLTLRRADVVVTISQAVKDDVLRQYGDRFSDRIVPIWNPIALDRLAGGEPQKAGVLPEAADEFLKACRERHGLAISGLMCIPPANELPAPHFALTAKIAARNGLTLLSMGMSADFATAIAFGATHVRVGTAIFGGRG